MNSRLFLIIVLFLAIFVQPEIQCVILTGKGLLNNVMIANNNNNFINTTNFNDASQVLTNMKKILLQEDLFISTAKNRCADDLILYGRDLILRAQWALQMMDSSAKMPEGIFTGHFYFMGNFDECLNISVPEAQFVGQHCMATFSPYSENTTDIRLKYLSIHWATCIPSSCSAGDWQSLLQHLFVKLNNSLQVTVTDSDCHTKNENDTLRAGDWITIVILMHLAVLVILSTAYDLWHKETGPNKHLYTAFSVYSNGKKLLSTASSEDSLHALHGIRFLTMAWIVLDHQYMVSVVNTPIENTTEILNLVSEWYRMYLLNGTLSVDTFFLMSGLLISYIFFTRIKGDMRLSSFNIPLFYLHRYVRLTPALAMLVLLQTTILRFLGSGPLWKSGFTAMAEPCQKYWWSTLLYIQNYVNPDEMCLGHTWYLSVDTQLYLISPLLLIMLWKKPKITVIVLSIMVVVGMIIDFVLAYIYGFTPNILGESDYVKQQSQFYVPTHTRFSPWLVGIIVGFFIHRAKETSYQLYKVEVMWGWACSVILSLGSLYIAYPMIKQDYTYNVWECSLYLAIFRTTWSLGIAWIIFACALGYGGPVNTVLSWCAWQPLSRLTYDIYLIHILVLVFEALNTKVTHYYNDTDVVVYFLGNLCLSALLSILLSLSLEYPIVTVEKYLTEKYSSRRKPDVQTSSEENEEVIERVVSYEENEETGLLNEEAGIINEICDEGNTT